MKRIVCYLTILMCTIALSAKTKLPTKEVSPFAKNRTKISVQGPLNTKKVRTGLAEKGATIQELHQSLRKKAPTISGRVKLLITISNTGKVSAVTIDRKQSTYLDYDEEMEDYEDELKLFEKRVLAEVKSWKIPVSKGIKKSSTVVYIIQLQ